MKNRLLAAVGLLLLCACGAAAQGQSNNQTNLIGQLFFPGGDPPHESIRFMFTSDDGMRNELMFTDSQGRFAIPALDNRRSYTIIVTGDGVNFGDTVYQVPNLMGRMYRVTIDLNPPKHKPGAPGATISAASGYKPQPKAENLYDRAQKELQKNHRGQAEMLLRKAVEADPKYPLPLNDLGVLLMQEKKYPEAEQYLRQAIAGDPKFINALLNLGITLNHLERYADAITPLREVLRLEPRLTMAHKHLGIALVETAQYAEAEHELNAVQKVTSAEHDPVVSLYLGQLYARTGQYEKSIAEFNAYLEEAPSASNVEAVRALVAKMQRKILVRQ